MAHGQKLANSQKKAAIAEIIIVFFSFRNASQTFLIYFSGKINGGQYMMSQNENPGKLVWKILFSGILILDLTSENRGPDRYIIGFFRLSLNVTVEDGISPGEKFFAPYARLSID